MSVSVRCKTIDVRLGGDLGPFSASLSCAPGATEGVYSIALSVTAERAARLPNLSLFWDLPSIDFHHKWNPKCMQNRALDIAPGSYNHVDSSANSGMPVYSLYNLNGVNACTWALSDVVHDTRTGGVYRHGKEYRCEAVVYGDGVGVTDRYDLTIRFDFRRIPYYEVLRDVTKYWESLPGCAPRPVPEAARLPLLSSWYLYTLDLDRVDLERQCLFARQLGFSTVVLDDGWQTDQLTTGYRNNGDWEVSTAKFPDFADHVRRVQAMGLKYMVWFSVPFVGVESKAFQRFQNMLLPAKEGADHFCLDPRFGETREYLASTYEAFVRLFGVDGLKLDFIGTIIDRIPREEAPDDRRDCVSVGEAVCALLDDVTARLRRINPDFLIEFRQAYNGPAMRPHATMLRAVDCPNSIGDNRVRTLDIRLLSGDTAVHSDPITWHEDEPVHSAAMQIVHVLFSVPQVSLRISSLCESHRRMLGHQIGFAREHRDVLQGGELRPLSPHLLYPLVIAKTRGKLLAAFHADVRLRLDEEIPPLLILVNGSYAPELLVDLGRDLGAVEVVVQDCCGEVVSRTETGMGVGLHRVPVPPAGNARIRCCAAVAKRAQWVPDERIQPDR